MGEKMSRIPESVTSERSTALLLALVRWWEWLRALGVVEWKSILLEMRVRKLLVQLEERSRSPSWRWNRWMEGET